MFMDLGGGIISPPETSPGEGAGAVHKNSALCGVLTWPFNPCFCPEHIHANIQSACLHSETKIR